MKVLIIEDDKKLANLIKEELQRDYVVEIIHSGVEGKYLIEVYEYDVIILDLSLPDMDGILLCQSIRKQRIKAPILILTGELDLSKKVSTFDAGADDYITKPFHFPELKARLRALLRRQSQNITGHVLVVGDLELDPLRKVVKRDGSVIHLQRKEFQILEYFMRNTNVLITRNMILEHIWKSEFESVTNVVDVHIKYLRDRIDKQFSKKLIKTVYGVGYKMET